MLRPPWYHGWNVLAVAMAFQAVSFGTAIYCFTFFVDPLASEFSVGRGRVMALFVTLQIAMGVAAPFAGRALDRFSLAWLVPVGVSCLVLALVLIVN